MNEGSRGDQVLAARRETLQRLRSRGVDPFALRFQKDAGTGDIRRQFDGIEPGAETGTTRAVAGRIMLDRRHGRLAFLQIRDGSGDLQLFCSEDAMDDESWALLADLDLGDIVGATGEVVKTKRGELSIKVSTLTLLTKSLRPLPEKWHGLKDPELRIRRRYLQFATQPES